MGQKDSSGLQPSKENRPWSKVDWSWPKVDRTSWAKVDWSWAKVDWSRVPCRLFFCCGIPGSVLMFVCIFTVVF